MKARKVKGLHPAATVGDNAERIVRTRLAELCDFMPKAGDPQEVEALHDMRIAAKRLRYILEVTGSCFGPYAETAVKAVKELQDLLGELHDCDVQLPEVASFTRERVLEDAQAVLLRSPKRAADLDPKLVSRAPNRADYAGLAALEVFLRARRDLLFATFIDQWQELERKGFRARLEYAVSERAGNLEPD
ncbi:MAG: CHAD domain-containing protein [Solirubrobacterales bacterium]|nr:CHAD domain-containing protein [Solirubrobacterales bacterium]